MYKEAPKGWKELKLAQLIDFYIGGDWGEESQISSDYVETKVIRATDISNWEKTNGKNAQIRYLKTSSLEKRELKEGDIVIEISGGSPDQPVGRSIVIKKDKQDNKIYTCSNFFRLIRIDNNEVLPEFLNYYFRFLYDTRIIEQYQSNSTNLRNLKFKQFIAQKIPYPSELREQQEIVQVLDTMSDIIRLREECISHAQELIPALFQEIFGDINNNVTKSNIVRFRNCIELNPAKPNLKDNLNVTFLGMKDIGENGQVNLSTIKMYEDVKKGFTNFENEDVLLAKITPCFENGKAAIVRNLTNGYGFGSTEFYVLRPHKKLILPEYVYSIIKSHSFAEPGKYKMVGAAGQKRLPKEYVLNYKFPLPSIELQEQFAEKVRAINSYIKEQNEELENAKQMFQSLLHHAFTGELTRRAYGG